MIDWSKIVAPSLHGLYEKTAPNYLKRKRGRSWLLGETGAQGGKSLGLPAGFQILCLPALQAPRWSLKSNLMSPTLEEEFYDLA